MCQKFLSVAELFYRRKLSAKELWAKELWAEEKKHRWLNFSIGESYRRKNFGLRNFGLRKKNILCFLSAKAIADRDLEHKKDVFKTV